MMLANVRPLNATFGPNPYLREVVRWQLARVRKQWLRYQCSRCRNAIYLYLAAVFDLVTSWNGDADRCARLGLDLQGHPTPRRVEPFAVVIRCTSDPAKVDARTRSKWSRALRFADRSKKPSEPLGGFIRNRGGINKCATRASVQKGPGRAD
jgi:hypothetical protein